ncbi:MAG TPA: monofunctional biosynthetic peptidoglycan transglycosylase [Beijerinckia sp.]|jgi:monofunctional biosynthetic peptidoglycan transglycosylase|nr:monofunctional biosynthetic peptidoglycan transglycosylase [Beijerinckia sp.]
MASRSALFGKLVHCVLGVTLALMLLFVGMTLAYRFMTPISTLMLARIVQGEELDRRFVPLPRISARLIAAVIASEDARFCIHDGVDWDALSEVIDTAKAATPSRGASTITMQTAKNLFLWPARSVIRKGVEIPLALLIDLAWPKPRVLEVYLNIAEWGEGIFGAEAAAQHYFHKSAEALDSREAALLATALPNPRHRNPARPSRRHLALAATIMARARDAHRLTECVEDREGKGRSLEIGSRTPF